MIVNKKCVSFIALSRFYPFDIICLIIEHYSLTSKIIIIDLSFRSHYFSLEYIAIKARSLKLEYAAFLFFLKRIAVENSKN
jgi:hypothetical protein